MKKIVTIHIAILVLAVPASAQRADESKKWELVAIGAPVLHFDDDSPGFRASIQLGKNFTPHISWGFRPSYEVGRNEKRKGAFQFYLKYRKPFKPKLNWFIQAQAGYGFHRDSRLVLNDFADFMETGESLTYVDRKFWESRLDVAYGIEVKLSQTFQGLVVVNTSHGLQLGVRNIF